MMYYLDDKSMWDSIIIRNEQKFFAWLAQKLKPEYAWFLEQRDANANDDCEVSWYSYCGTERAYITDLMLRCAENGSASFELNKCDTQSGVPESYSYSVDYHYAKSASDIPADFEKANSGGYGVNMHAWKNGIEVDENEEVFENIVDDADCEIVVYTL